MPWTCGTFVPCLTAFSRINITHVDVILDASCQILGVRGAVLLDSWVRKPARNRNRMQVKGGRKHTFVMTRKAAAAGHGRNTVTAASVKTEGEESGRE